MKTKLIVIFSILIVLSILAFLGGMLGAGPFGYAQRYQFYVNKLQLIKSIEKLKSENRSLNPPGNYNMSDSLDTLTTHFNVSVYYPDENTIIYFYIDNKPNDNNNSFINLVSVNQDLNQATYKLVNRDFDRRDNLRIKNDFEIRVLNKLKLRYTDRGNGMFVFWK